jgi:hypothetical protein
MQLYIFYIIVALIFIFTSFVILGERLLYSRSHKIFQLIMAILSLVYMCRLVQSQHSSLHIFGLIGTALVSSLIFGIIFKITVLKKPSRKQ